jgi:hypothetical protein
VAVKERLIIINDQIFLYLVERIIIITVFNKQVILDEMVKEQSGYPANIVIFTMVLKFIMQAYSGMKMPA